MVITSRVHTTLFAPSSTVSKELIRLPPSVVQQYETRCELSGRVLVSAPKPPHRLHLWSSDEHDRFLQGLELFPNGPWKEITAIVGTKTTRQTMTHAQKYRQKIERRLVDRPVRPKKRHTAARGSQQRTHVLSALEKIELVYGSVATGVPVNSTRKAETVFDLRLPDRTHHVAPRSHATLSPMDVSTGVGYDPELEALLECLEPISSFPDVESAPSFSSATYAPLQYV